MKKVILLIVVVFVAAAGWQIGRRLSSDAVGMAVGMLFGIMAGIPVALLVLASHRQGDRDEPPSKPLELAYRPSVIVLTGAPVASNAIQRAATEWGGVPEWDRAQECWTIVDPASRQVLAVQRKRLSG